MSTRTPVLLAALAALALLAWLAARPGTNAQGSVDPGAALSHSSAGTSDELEGPGSAPPRTAVGEGVLDDGAREPTRDPAEVAGAAIAPEPVLRGRVLDRTDGRPLEGIAILASSEAVTRTDADGRFRVLTATIESFRVLRLLPPAGAPKLLRIPEPLPADEVVVWIERAASLRGTVLDARAQPAVGFLVQATTSASYLLDPLQRPTPWEGQRHAAPHWCAVTDATGSFAMDRIAGDAPLALSVHAPPAPDDDFRVDTLGRFEPLPRHLAEPVLWVSLQPLRLDPGEAREIEVRLSEPGRVAGAVVDELGTPAAEVEVWLIRLPSRLPQLRDFGMLSYAERRTRTAADGSFRFDDVLPGRWLVGVAPLENPSSEDFATRAESIEVPSSGARNVRIEAHRGLGFAGRLLDPEGEGVPQALLRVDDIDGTSWRTVSTDHEGRFRLAQLSPGDYTFELALPDELELLEPKRARPGGPELLLRTGPRPVAALRGRIIDPGSEGPFESDYWIRPTPRPAPRGHTSTVLTNDPDFRLEGLAPGLYDIFFGAGRDRVALLEGVTLAAGEVRDGVEVVLSPGGRMNLSYRGPHPRVTVTVRRGDAFVTRVDLTPAVPGIVVLPTGLLQVELANGAETVWDGNITIRAGEVTRLEVP